LRYKRAAQEEKTNGQYSPQRQQQTQHDALGGYLERIETILQGMSRYQPTTSLVFPIYGIGDAREVVL
jgi:hypothetical protein